MSELASGVLPDPRLKDFTFTDKISKRYRGIQLYFPDIFYSSPISPITNKFIISISRTLCLLVGEAPVGPESYLRSGIFLDPTGVELGTL